MFNSESMCKVLHIYSNLSFLFCGKVLEVATQMKYEYKYIELN